MASKRSQKLIKNELETKSTKHVENVLKLIPLDLQETRFRMEWLSKITEIRGAEKYTKIQKKCVEMKIKSMKNRSRHSTKNGSFKNRDSKIQKYSKKDSKMDPRK